METIICKYLQGEATEEEKKMLLSWLDEKEEHKMLFSELRDIWLTSEGLSEKVNHEQAYALFLDRITAHKRSNTKSLFIVRLVAVIIILLAGTTSAYFFGIRKGIQSAGNVDTIINHFTLGKNSKDSVFLPDGTLVWLHSESKLSFPQCFSNNERRVQLEGEAYFKVEHENDKPFYVETKGMEVKVLGTSFNMKSYSWQPISEIALLSGNVEVLISQTAQKVNLIPDQKLTITDKGIYNVEDINSPDYILWINDKISFSNERLGDILIKLERWYNIDIDYKKGVDVNQRLSLTVRRELKEEIFKSLELIAQIRCTIENNKVMISPK